MAFTISHPNFYWHADPAAARSLSALDVAKAYNFPTGVTGAGATIALIELGGGYKQSDLDKYFSGLGLPTPHVTSVSVSGGQNTPGGNADAEVLLDIQVAGAVAPGAAIRVYFAPNTDAGFLAAVLAAVADGVTVISISWGAAEPEWDRASVLTMDQAFQKADAAGIVVLVAAGDSGANDGERTPSADFPASSPHAVACGGTRLLLNPDGSRANEVVWNDGANSATGGGYSIDFTRPVWQPASIGEYRGVPDIAGNADPNTGYKVVINGSWEVIGGTSAVAPLFAGLIALLHEKGCTNLASFGVVPYTNPALCYDVVAGNNRGYSAGASWDATTGMGVPIGSAYASFLAPTGPPPAQPPTNPPTQPTPPPTPVPVPTGPDSADLALAAAFAGWLKAKGLSLS